jgi:hypothetical protein
VAVGEDHAGLVFIFDATLPRSKAAIGLWVQTLAALLGEHADERALQNQIVHLPRARARQTQCTSAST